MKRIRSKTLTIRSSKLRDSPRLTDTGRGDVVYDIAETIAKARGQQTDDGLTSIEVEDVQQAADHLLRALRQQVDSGVLPSEVAMAIGQMAECVESTSN